MYMLKGNQMNYQSTFTSLEELGATGYQSIRFKVKGYWSSDSITIYLQRSYNLDNADWTATISHSSGGRDNIEVTTDAEAVRYFAEAMVAAADLADMLMANTDVLEANFQAYRAERNAEIAAEKAVAQAKIDADAELGLERAQEIVDGLTNGKYQLVSVLARGQDRPRPLSCTIRAKAKLYLSGSIIAKKDAILLLAGSSARTLDMVV